MEKSTKLRILESEEIYRIARIVWKDGYSPYYTNKDFWGLHPLVKDLEFWDKSRVKSRLEMWKDEWDNE